MLHQLKNGDWIDLADVHSLIARPASNTIDLGPRVSIDLIRSDGLLSGRRSMQIDVFCDSFEAACAYRDELAALVNAACRAAKAAPPKSWRDDRPML